LRVTRLRAIQALSLSLSLSLSLFHSLLLVLSFAAPLQAEAPLRFATYNGELSRKGPGLLLRDILRRDAPVEAVAGLIVLRDPDVLLLTGFDWDLDGRALTAFAGLLAGRGADYPYQYAPKPNAGVASGFDLDRNGILGEARDSLGYGAFTGQGAMALLSKLPLLPEQAQDFTALLWRDAPGAAPPEGYFSADIMQVLPLASVGLWDLPLLLPGGGAARVLAFYATTPLFDGEEDRNGRRNRDEMRFWIEYLKGAGQGVAGQGAAGQSVAGQGGAGRGAARQGVAGRGVAGRDAVPLTGVTQGGVAPDRVAQKSLAQDGAAPAGVAQASVGVPFVLMGDSNVDAGRGAGYRSVMAELLRDPALQDVVPLGVRGSATVDWGKAGPMRVDYVLPSAGWRVLGSGVDWAEGGDSRHGLVWVDLAH
jgi:endonuclease/exonuclease/phosphatase family protein